MKTLRIKVCPQPGHCPGVYIPSNVPSDHPQFGQPLPCACLRRRQAEAIQRALPPKLRTMTFESFRATDRTRQALMAAKSFAAEPWREKYFLTLIGSNQLGKTHLAAAILNDLLARGEPAYFENVPALLDRLRSGYADDHFWPILDQVKAAPILVLDDLGAEHRGRGESLAATWAEDKLYQIVDQRVVTELPTIFTTNLTRALIAPRLSSRMWNERYALVVAVTGILDSESTVRRSSAQPTSSHT
jgi:DNA replication protein DnaC